MELLLYILKISIFSRLQNIPIKFGLLRDFYRIPESIYSVSEFHEKARNTSCQNENY